MTTITVDRTLLVRMEKELFLARNYGGILRDEPLLKEVSDALAAPATAPAQPAWHNAPTVPGLWVCRQAITDNVQAYEVTDQMALNRNLKLKGQWYGPIPEDKP